MQATHRVCPSAPALARCARKPGPSPKAHLSLPSPHNPYPHLWLSIAPMALLTILMASPQSPSPTSLPVPPSPSTHSLTHSIDGIPTEPICPQQHPETAHPQVPPLQHPPATTTPLPTQFLRPPTSAHCLSSGHAPPHTTQRRHSAQAPQQHPQGAPTAPTGSPSTRGWAQRGATGVPGPLLPPGGQRPPRHRRPGCCSLPLQSGCPSVAEEQPAPTGPIFVFPGCLGVPASRVHKAGTVYRRDA